MLVFRSSTTGLGKLNSTLLSVSAVLSFQAVNVNVSVLLEQSSKIQRFSFLMKQRPILIRIPSGRFSVHWKRFGIRYAGNRVHPMLRPIGMRTY